MTIDEKNLEWFKNDNRYNTLTSLTISGCNIRGIFPTTVDFSYPITAIAGANGSGKSTILALVSCAFHNNTPFCPLSLRKNASKTGRRERRYYIYNDFFTFTSRDNGLLSEIRITSHYVTSLSKNSDVRKKRPNGKWNNNDERPNRVVSFMGINRILPPSESSAHKVYRNSFADDNLATDVEKKLKQYATTIFGYSYDDVKLHSHNVYKLFSVKKRIGYTGFNMGAGENAVLSMLYEILSAGEGALIVIDEIELGLHASAQSRFIGVLKEICNDNHCQIVCSTHSKWILDSLPPCARLLISSNEMNTTVIPEVSTNYAIGVMSGKDVPELDILVEDEIAETFVINSLRADQRHRVKVYPIGSADAAIPNQMAGYYREQKYQFCTIMDGDKKSQHETHIKHVCNALETRLNHSREDFNRMMSERLSYLPGERWPECHILNEIKTKHNYSPLASWGQSEPQIDNFIDQAIAAGKHHEFDNLSISLGLDRTIVLNDVIRTYISTHTKEIAQIQAFIDKLL